MSITDYLKESAKIINDASVSLLSDDMENAIDICVKAILDDKPILVCGNGGSDADAMHIAGELMVRFLINRQAINCISLSSNTAMMTAWCNDREFETIFERGVEAYGKENAVLIGISTSGTSKNVILAAKKAKETGMSVISMTGKGGADLAEFSDVLLDAPSKITAMIQQVHICLYHYLCEEIEKRVSKARGEI